MHDSVGLQLGTSLQSAKLQLANLLQNCYFCLIQKTISNSILWSLVIKHFWPGCFAPPCLLRPGATAPLCPPLLRHWSALKSALLPSCSCGVTQGSAWARCSSSPTYVQYSQHNNTVWRVCPPIADNTQLYIALSKSDMNMCVDKLQNCLSTVHLWFSQNGIVVNPEKSEAVLLSTSQQARASIPPLTGVNVAGCVMPLTDTVKILGVTIDHHLTFNTQVYKTSASRHTTIFEHGSISNVRHGKSCCVRAGQFAS